jgi:hypothetical protein
MPTPPFWFFPLFFPGGTVPIGFTVPGYVFDSVSFRPLGSAAFSHYGDKVGVKLRYNRFVDHGVSTVSSLFFGYASIGIAVLYY